MDEKDPQQTQPEPGHENPTPHDHPTRPNSLPVDSGLDVSDLSEEMSKARLTESSSPVPSAFPTGSIATVRTPSGKEIPDMTENNTHDVSREPSKLTQSEPSVTATEKSMPDPPAKVPVNHSLEVACFSPESALTAAAAGADCIHVYPGGSGHVNVAWFKNYSRQRKDMPPETVNDSTSIPAVPMRIYLDTDEDLLRGPDVQLFSLEERIKNFKNTRRQDNKFRARNLLCPEDSFMFGITDRFGAVDLERNKSLVELAAPYPCTFAGVFQDYWEARNNVEPLIQCGFKSFYVIFESNEDFGSFMVLFQQ
ncbi:hypothetical protein M011DRAFT_477626 [Sporormia fimetaria CBS 119925]|uniref:Uncharacterized protein n=1 Tax=Sporormia fimetaria CBS 119925 TaxID=1340428 RepID=A0A6A6VDA1_9PLEO|nr:hypothetical protein M011DRAFT_477626 [Sporormia fimetaria CBS 119925]